ncbi:antitoxin MazE family protein [Microbaculum sp. FT89]|uniref:antitoxin MazE family protein n=1 Tax=Microbaculum sp. FT89 TaxID=3447298 RepID=UPI003F53AFE4
MPSNSSAKSSRDKVRAHRQRLRAQGLRPVQIWVPDTRTADFRARAQVQSAAVARSESERADQAFIDTVSVLDEA